MVTFPACLFAQTTSYSIKGKVGHHNAPARVFLIHSGEGGNPVADSSMLVNGSFSFSGTIAEPEPGVLVLDPKGVGLAQLNPQSRPDVLHFYLEKGNIQIEGADSLARATVSGKTNQENQQLQNMLKPVAAKSDAFNREYMAATPEQKGSQDYMDGMRKKYETITEEQNRILKKFIMENPSSYVSLSALRNVAGDSPDPAELQPLVSALSEDLRKSPSIKPLLDQLEIAKRTSVGIEAIDFTQNDVNGKPVKLSDFRGKFVLLDFWASWCGPCRQENPNVVKAYNTYKDKNFTVLGVSLDRQNGREAWLKAIKDDGLTWTQVSDLQFWNNEVARMYGVQSIPKNFLINPEGKIIAVNLRGDDLFKTLADVLK